MPKFAKTAVAALAVMTISTAMLASSNEAQARPRWGWVGAGLAAGALIGAAAASSAYAYPYYGPAYGAGPAYVAGPDYVSCAYVRKYNAWGEYVGTRKVCTAY